MTSWDSPSSASSSSARAAFSHIAPGAVLGGGVVVGESVLISIGSTVKPLVRIGSSAIVGAGLGKDVALLTDGRFSGGSHGFIAGHITPEAQAGGPLALVVNGDQITIDVETNTLSVALSDEELTARRKSWTPPPLKATRGTLYKYIKNVKSASEGCVTDE